MKKSILLNKFWLFLAFFFSFLFLLASYIPNFYETSIVKLLPQERQMLRGEHIYTYDYNVYLSKIRQGMEGRWSVVDKYDNSPNQKGVLLQMLYLISGKIGGLFDFTPGLTFHLLRTVASVFWVLTIIFLSFYFLKKPLFGFLGALLSIFAASWPVFYAYQGSTWIGMYMAWWQEMDVLKRISYIPHYTLNYIIISVLTLLLASYPSNFLPIKSGSNFKIICIVLFFSFFIHPSAGLLFIISWLLYHIINTIWFKNYDRFQLAKIAYDTIILFLVAFLPLIYFKYVTSDYPWKSLIDFDKLYRYPVNVKDYILALGPVFFTGALGLIIVLIKKEQKYLSLVSWLLGAFIAIFVFKKFPFQSELRFVQTANHVPLAILSIHFLFSLKEILIRKKTKMPVSSFSRSPKSLEGEFLLSEKHGIEFSQIIVNFFVYGIILAIITLGLTQSYFSIKSQTDFIHQRVVAGQPLAPYPPQVMYPLKDLYTGMMWLDDNSKNEDIVLSHIYAGNYIPAYSGNFVYLGHNPETPNYDERVRRLEAFYSGTLTNEDAEKFLKEENIKYVVYGPQEKEKSVEDIKKYSFLKVVFDSTYVKIYKVKM